MTDYDDRLLTAKNKVKQLTNELMREPDGWTQDDLRARLQEAAREVDRLRWEGRQMTSRQRKRVEQYSLF